MRPVFDTHFHFTCEVPLHESVRILNETCEECNVRELALLSLPTHGLSMDPIQNVQALGHKKLLAPRAFALAGPMHNQALSEEEQAADFVRQAKLYKAAGFDGLKMLEGKPAAFRMIGRKIDDPVFDPLYSYCEETNFPIVMHVGDPEEFWDLTRIDKYALEHGWFCDESVPSFDDLQNSIFHLLDKHPNLTLVIAHWGFFSYHRERAEKFFTYKNTYIDVTPAPQEILTMTKELDFWRPFILAHADRYLFGTDSYNCRTYHHRPRMMHNFFETGLDAKNDYVGNIYCGIEAPDEVIEKIYGENAHRILGATPAPIDEALVRKMIEEARPKVAPGSFEEEELNTLTKLFK